MVEYACKFCKANYDSFEEAYKCEKQGLIGPEIEPGLLLSSTQDGSFLILYKELNPKGHYRKYLFGEIYFFKTELVPIKLKKIKSSKLDEILNEEFKISTEEEINEVNKAIRNKFPLTGEVRNSMKKYNINKVHNNLELKLVEVAQ